MASCLVQEADSTIENLIHRWGNSASEATLEFDCHYFSLPQIDGCIGYHVAAECAIVFGDPICSWEDVPELTTAFHHFCQEKGWNIIYVIASEKFSKWCIQEKFCNIQIEVGEELVFNPENDLTLGPPGNKFRNQLNHTSRHGLQVKEYLAYDEELEHAMQQVGQAWLKGRVGPQIYLGNLDFFSNRIGKRWFYVQDNEKITAMAMLSRLEAYQGWLLKYCPTIPYALRGTSEVLMLSILETLRNEDCHYLTYGMVPKEHLGEILGLGKISTWIAKHVFLIISRIFHLEQRKLYWYKFHPQALRSFVLLNQPHIGFREIRALTKAFKIKLKNKYNS